MSEEVRARVGKLVDEPFALTCRDGRWLALAAEHVAFAADDDAGWRRLAQEGWLLGRWRAAGIPAPRVVREDPTLRVQLRERLHGLSGEEIHREHSLSPIYAGDRTTADRNPDVHERLHDAQLSRFGERLAASYGEMAARIRRAVTVEDAVAAGLPPTSRRSLNVDAAIAALETTHGSEAAKHAARRSRDWLVELPPIDAVIHADLHFHNMVAAPSGDIVGIFDLSDTGPDAAAGEFLYVHSLGSRFARIALEAYGMSVDERAVIHAHLRTALDHVLWHGPGTPRHDSLVAWATAAFEHFG